ncbi:hypothetical protein ACFQ8C_29665 [Streptomyces sp. NPDC056503]|uniref:hypothetical protein n=1 Tax=Streptomyces sp. NPDC056503 TaxID=3345842 RepID=UPI00369D175C
MLTKFSVTLNESVGAPSQGPDFRTTGEIFLRYHHFIHPVTLSVGNTTFLDEEPVPVLDFLLVLERAVGRLRDGESSGISFTESPEKIVLDLREDDLVLKYGDTEAICPVSDFVIAATGFLHDALEAVTRSAPSLRQNAFVIRLRGLVDSHS